MMEYSAKVISFDSRNPRGRTRRRQSKKPTSPIFLIAAALIACLVFFAFGFFVGYLAAHTSPGHAAQSVPWCEMPYATPCGNCPEPPYVTVHPQTPEARAAVAPLLKLLVDYASRRRPA